MDILPQLLVNALISGSLYALASAGLALSYGLLRILNFAHGHLMMAGAYLFLAASVGGGFAVPVAGGLALVGAALLSAVALAVFIRPFLRYSTLLPFVTTLALATMLESAVAMIFGVNVRSLNTGLNLESWEVYGVYFTPIQVLIVTSALVLLGLLAALIHGTALGRRLRALAEHGPAAQALGVSERAVSYGVFILGGCLAAYAGILIGYETNLQPTMGGGYTIKAFAAMVLGGLGNVWGTVAGAYLLGLIENLSIGLEFGGVSLPAGYKDAFAFMIILLVLLIRPQGLFRRAGRRA